MEASSGTSDIDVYIEAADLISKADDTQLGIMNRLMEMTLGDLMRAKESTDNPKFIKIIEDTIESRFPDVIINY